MFLVAQMPAPSMARGPQPKNPVAPWSLALKTRRVQLGLRQEDVAARTGDEISQGTISDLERTKTHLSNLTYGRVRLLATALDWSPAALAEATGVQLYLDGSADDVRPANLDEYVLVEARSIAHAGPDDSIQDLPPATQRLVPRSALRRDAVAILITGDSMTRPDGGGVHAGDLVMLDPHDRDLRDGEAYIIRIHGNGWVLKRARLLMGEWYLFSDNPNFPPYKPDQADVEGQAYLHVPAPRKP